MSDNYKEIYDKCQEISKEIDIINSKKEVPPQQMLDDLEGDFNKILQFTKERLIVGNCTLYGNILLYLGAKIDFSIDRISDIDIDNMKILVNPLYCYKYKYKEFIGMIIFEILSFAFDAPGDFKRYNPMENKNKHINLEDALEASIGELIKNDIRIGGLEERQKTILPQTNFFTKSDIEIATKKTIKQKESIEYYFQILELYRKQQSQNSLSTKNLEENSEEDKKELKNISSPSKKIGKGFHNWEASSQKDISAKIHQSMAYILNNMSAKDRGNIPGSVSEKLNKYLNPSPISWREFLMKVIGTIPTGKKSTPFRFNRLQPYRRDLKGTFPDRIVELIICIDTSGSMGKAELSYCLSEISNILKQTKTKITVIECDAEVGKVYKVKSSSDIQYNLTGRGGTAFTPAIEYINKHNFKSSFMIYLTDGMGEDKIPQPNTIGNLWLVFSSKKSYGISLKNPYGEVFYLFDDEKFKKYFKTNE